MRIKAAIMDLQGKTFPFVESRPFSVEDIDLDGPGPGEVLVEVKAAGLCHSDMSTVEGMRPRKVPVVGGHEGAGTVIEIGRDVKSLKAGDSVVLTAASGCGCCSTCCGGRPVLCEAIPRIRLEGILSTGSSRFFRNGSPIYHYSGVSSFSQFTVVTEQTAVRIDRSYPLDVAALFGCAVLTGAGAVFKAARAKPGQSVCVIGLGGVGLNVVMAARAAGCEPIIGIDVNPEKFTIALELGCSLTFDGRDTSAVAAIRDLTNGGADIAIEVSGRQEGVDMAFAATRRGGAITCVGIAGYGTRFAYPHTSIVGDEKVVRGSLLGSGQPHIDIPAYLALFAAGKLPVDRLISDRIGLEDLNHGLDRLKTGSALRQVILP